MAAFPWDDVKDARLRELAANGTSVRAMAEVIGASKSVVDRRLKHLGVTLDRTATEAATRANVVDAKARRYAIVHRMYDEAEALLADLEKGRAGKGWKTILKGEYGIEETKSLDFIPIRDRRDAADTISRFTDRAVRLEQVDAAGGAQAIVGILQQTAAALGLDDSGDTQP